MGYRVRRFFGLGAPNYNSYADLNIDGRIDILDMALLAFNYGRSYQS